MLVHIFMFFSTLIFAQLFDDTFSQFGPQNGSQNDLKMIQLSSQASPRDVKIQLFLQKVVLGATCSIWLFMDGVLAPFLWIWCSFWLSFWLQFHGFGAYFNWFACFCDHFGLHFNIIWKIGVGGGGGKAQFPKSHFSASKPLSASQPLTGTVRTCFATWIYIYIPIVSVDAPGAPTGLHFIQKQFWSRKTPIRVPGSRFSFPVYVLKTQYMF